LFLQRICDHRVLHSFPTRRSSDLVLLGDDVAVAGDGLDDLAEVGRLLLVDEEDAAAAGALEWFEDGLAPELIDERGDLGLVAGRSEEHTSELQSRENLVCRLLLEK